MIDFNKADGLKRRVTKFKVQEGIFYLLDMSSTERKEAIKEVDEADGEAIMFTMIDCYLCDEKGKLLHIKPEKVALIRDGLLRDIFEAIQGALIGEKKS